MAAPAALTPTRPGPVRADPGSDPVPVASAGRAREHRDKRFVDGGDLQSLVHASGGLSLDRAVDVLKQVANAVDVAHAHGLVHRDVKPSNILLDTGVRDFCYLADFGITRAAVSGATSNSLTRTGALLGSLAHMAPEQFDGAVTRQSDVYALTCVFFEMITGDRPYAGEGLPVLMHSHLKIPPPRPSERHPGAALFDELVAVGMAKAAAGRFDSAGALVSASAVKLRLEGARAKAELLGLDRQVGVTDPAYLHPRRRGLRAPQARRRRRSNRDSTVHCSWTSRWGEAGSTGCR